MVKTISQKRDLEKLCDDLKKFNGGKQMKDDYNLERFIKAQEQDYQIALTEIKNGSKKSHWMWYIFPQLADLGYSEMAKFYGIKNKDEAKAYLDNSYLRKNLIEISNELYQLNNHIEDILGHPDDLKLLSCMTLFHYIDPKIDIFEKIIQKFYNGKYDMNTLNLLNIDMLQQYYKSIQKIRKDKFIKNIIFKYEIIVEKRVENCYNKKWKGL